MPETFAVEPKGKGRPDYSPIVGTTKPVVGVEQERWELQITRSAELENAVPARSVAAIPAYTVPEKRKLHIGGAIVTCNASCIQKICMTHITLIGMYRYDIKGELMFGALSSSIIDAGNTLNIYIYNEDIVARDFSVTIVGVLEKVAE